VGRRGRFLVILLATTVFGILVRVGLASVGIVAAGLVFPLVMALPWLIITWYQFQERQRSMCPKCELPLSYRQLGPSHGMLECPTLCGYRKLVGDLTSRP
jgi:hypothetical protein